MSKNKRFETLLSLFMTILTAAIAIISVSLNLPVIVTYFFGGMSLLFAVIVAANVCEENK
jgi:hypothetical protein